MARKPHEPTEATRAKVQALAAFGVTQEDISKYIDLDSKTLRKHYRAELDQSLIDNNLIIGQSLFDNATTQKNVAAQIFWLKTKGGWKEAKDEIIHDNSEIQKVLIEVVNGS